MPLLRKTKSKKTMVGRWASTMVALAVSAPALAAPIDDARALIAAIKSAGDQERAAQLQQVVDSMSESDLETFSRAGIRGMTELFYQQQEGIRAARVLGYLPPVDSEALAAPTRNTRNHVDEYPVFTDYTPDSVSCPNAPDQASIETIIALRATLVVTQAAYKLGKAIYESTDPVCHQLVVAIGIGTNPQTFVCVGLGIAETALHVAFDVTEKALELIEFCDDEVDHAKIRATFYGLDYVHYQLRNHDTEIKDQHDLHDVEVQALIDDLISRLTRMEARMDLLLKSQLEIAMDRKGRRSRPSVFYEDRLDELCDIAQEAVDDLPAVYIVASHTRELLAEGLALKATNPKLAVDKCIQAFTRATSGSSQLQ